MDIHFLTSLLIGSGIFLISEGVLNWAEFQYNWIFMLIIAIFYILYVVSFFWPALFRKIMLWIGIFIIIIIFSLVGIAEYFDGKDL